MNDISLIQANKNRAILIASAVSRRISYNNEWTGYNKTEGLDGELVRDNVMLYNRPGHRGGGRDALVHFIDPVLIEVKELDWGEPIVIESNVQERVRETINNNKPVDIEQEVSHTFSKTTTMSEAFKVGAELAVKVSAEEGMDGFKASEEVSVKLTAEYNRQWGESQTQTDTVTQKLHFPANTDVEYEAVRSIDKEQRKITAKCNFNYKIWVISAPGEPPLVDLEWKSLEEFISVAKGFASREHAGYDLFINNPLSQEEVDAILAPSDKTISWLVEYDNVQSQKITII